ncbi:RraA family protein [Rhodococcus sp. BGS-1C]|jgi:4-hydroxy-4-methyl-2-oxoglutarate aldolase|uniref:RraA family protein n=1 Tax=unclassified Rhodococcus (in: high G+C Gram-positive bacteria) TaxID=192944 RepID=UPI0019CFE10B|nr:RraA family protein [Rhodococcus sp. KRD197]
MTDQARISEELSTLDTSHLSDALDKLGLNGQCAGLLPLDRSVRLVGRAFTVRYVPVGDDGGTVGDYIDDLDPGTVVVLDNAGRLDTTVWGDLLTATAAHRGISGTVIDGVCRDSDCAVDLNYPLFSRSRWMRTGKDRVRVDGYNLPVSVGGVRVEQGDWLVGDADGVVSMPVGRIEEVIDIASGIRDTEDRIRSAVRAGQSLVEARREHGYHALQTRQRS